MPIRLATRADLPRLTEIAVEAFMDEPVIQFRWPYRHEHPRDFYDFWYYELQNAILQPKSILLLWETEGETKTGVISSGACTKIASFIGWQIRDDSYSNPRGLPIEKDSLQEELARRLAALRQAVYRMFRKDKAQDQAHEAEWRAAMKEQRSKYWTEKSTGASIKHWRISFVATDPEMQRRGYGTKLLQWGMDQADKDRLVCGVDAGEVGLNLYSPKGFKVLGKMVVGSAAATVWVCKRDPDGTANGPR